MRKNRIARIVRIALIAIVATGVVGFLVMGLWNWLMPALFSLPKIGFWQALGLFILSKLLFGGFHRHSGGSRHWRWRMMERWQQMTPQERERFRCGMRPDWGSPPPPRPEPAA